MPYERKGKCVHKKYSNGKISKKPVGCSDTVEKAKKYIQALYTSELNESLPNTLSPEENSKVKEFMKAFMDDKQSWIDQYGLEQANFVMYKTAVKKAKEKTTTMENSKLREMIKSALKNPKAADLNKDGELSDYEEKRGAAIEKALTKEAYADLSPEERKKVGIQYDYEDIGQFYLEKIGKDSKLPDEALGKIGKKVVKQLYKNDLGAAYKDIVKEDINEDLDLGHQDNEPHMLKSDLYRIGKYAMELYKMVDGFEYKGEVDFPHWWQAKIIKSKDMLVSAKHYLDFELNEPQIDAMVDVASEEEAIEEIDRNDPVMMKMRAAKDKKPNFGKEYGDAVKTAYGNDKNAKKLALLKKERAQLMRDMEQEAEPEGGPIADEYGSKLNRIDAAIAKLSGRKEMTYDQAIAENDSYVRVSEPKFIKDKNNPNFLYVNFKYDTGGGVLKVFGKETMAGQIRRLSSAEAMKQATALAKDLEAKYNLEDIDVYDKENGVVQIFAVSDDFMDMDPNMLSESSKDELFSEAVAEAKKLTYNDFVQMVKDDMMAGASPDEKPSEEQVKKKAKAYYNDYLQGTSVDDLFEAKVLKQAKLSSAEYQKAKKLKDFNKDDYKWNADESLYIKLK